MLPKVDADQLFVFTLDDLGRRVQRANDNALTSGEREYECLMIAFLLRKLLLDGHPLVDLVKRRHIAPILYPLVHWPVVSGSGGTPIEEGSGEAAPIWTHFVDELNLTRADMLGRPVAIWNNQVVTARDVIRHLANAAGGVHLGPPKGPKQMMLHELERTVRVQGFSIAGFCVAAVGGATHRALAPLRQEISAGISTPQSPST
jgi:hypothetical protein